MFDSFSSTTPFLAAIRARMSAIRAQRKALDSEYGELETAERVAQRLERVFVGPTQVESSALSVNRRETLPMNAAPKRQCDYIIAVLQSSENPWIESSQALHNEVVRIYNVHIPYNSWHPLVSKLKSDGIIVRKGTAVALKDRVKGRTEPDGSNSKEAAD